MKKIKLYLVALFALMGAYAVAQTEPVYIPDRPGYAANAFLVGLHQLDFEASVGFMSYANGADLTTTIYETNAFRYGAFKHLEFRAGFDVASVTFPDESSVTGVRSVYVGAKIPIIGNVKYAPDIALFGNVTLPYTGDVLLAPAQYSPSMALILQKSFGSVTIIGNAGVMWDAFTEDGYSFCNPNSIDRKAQGTYALAVYKFWGDVGIFVETYGYYSESTKPLASCDFGAVVAITPNVIADISCGVNYEKGIDNSFFNLGIGWLIPNKNK